MKNDLRQFLDAAGRALSQFSIAENSWHRCGQVAQAVRRAARHVGICAHVYECCVKNEGHQFCATNGYVFDFTLRQFYPKSPFPFVVRFNSPKFRRIYRSVSLYDAKFADAPYPFDSGIMDAIIFKAAQESPNDPIRQAILNELGHDRARPNLRGIEGVAVASIVRERRSNNLRHN